MKPSRRRVLAAVLVVSAGLGAGLAAGGQVAGCLGPLGVTPIQCAKATGIVPTVGPALPLFTLAAALGTLILVPVPADRRRGTTMAGGLCAVVAAMVFATAWESTWTGVDSAGTMLSIPRPLDLGALAAVAILAATVGALGWAFVVGPIHGRRAARA
jgi:hypothetical protein